MRLPDSIPHSLDCPLCPNKSKTAKLEWRLQGLLSQYLSYCCYQCGQLFTTTESDTISLKRYNSRKRGESRKIKIKRINGL